MHAPSASSPQIPLELWHAIFQHLTLPSGIVRLTGRHASHGSSLRFLESGVDRKVASALTSQDCLFPGSAQAVWHYILWRTTWKVRLPEDACTLRALELAVGIRVRHVEILVESRTMPFRATGTAQTPYIPGEQVDAIGEMLAGVAGLRGLQSLCVEVGVYHERGHTQAMAEVLEDVAGRQETSLAVLCRKMDMVVPRWVYDCDIVLRRGVVDRVSRIRLEVGEPRDRTCFMD